MRQVPHPPSPLGVVGDGRVARHVLHYLQLLGLPAETWSRRECARDPVDTLASCPTILLLLRDAAILPFIEAWPALRRARLIHFSGILVTSAAAAAHPLMTFGDRLYDLATYRRIPFVVDAGGPPLAELLPGWPNSSFSIAPADRPAYHALCALAGNGSSLLWLKLFETLETRFGIPAAAAHPYLSQVTANLRDDGLRALTGPLVRGDRGTIRTHLEALAGDPFRDVYAALVEAYDNRA
jgi:hypothetical protein